MDNPSRGAHVHHGVAEKDRNEQNLEKIARACEGIEKCGWNDVKEARPS